MKIERKLYELTPSQNVILLQTKYTLWPKVVNIVFSASKKEDMDLHLLDKAFNLVVQRNDCLRIRFVKQNKQLMQYFLEEDEHDFFLNSDDEYTVDINDTYLTVRHDTQIEDIPEDSNKPLDISRMFTVLNSAFRVNKTLVLTNVNNYRKSKLLDGTVSPYMSIKTFRESPDHTRFRVYYGGKLLNETEYNITLPEVYGGDVVISLKNVASTNGNKELIAEYLPINEDILYEDIVTHDIYHDELFWFDNIDRPLLADMLKVYVNGYRIPQSNVRDAGGINVFKIDGCNYGDFIQVFVKKM